MNNLAIIGSDGIHLCHQAACMIDGLIGDVPKIYESSKALSCYLCPAVSNDTLVGSGIDAVPVEARVHDSSLQFNSSEYFKGNRCILVIAAELGHELISGGLVVVDKDVVVPVALVDGIGHL